MDKFEQQFEDLDLHSQYMESAIDNTTSATMPESQVENLMAQVMFHCCFFLCLCAFSMVACAMVLYACKDSVFYVLLMID